MAVTQNSYTGDGSKKSYSFTFPYLKAADVKCSIDATVTTAFTLANATPLATALTLTASLGSESVSV